MTTTNIIFVGVGGQGIILASRILAEVAFRQGFMVKENELHGMAQRGGSVTSHVRFGQEVWSPLVPTGQADFLVALEELEGLRHLNYLKPQGTIILNQRKILPAGIKDENGLYPENILARLKELGCQVKEIPAFEIAKKAGSAKVENVVLLGALAKLLPLEKTVWRQVIEEAVPVKTREMNLAAWEKGFSSII